MPGSLAPCSDPAFSSRAAPASASPTVTSPGVPGERGGEQTVKGEHRFALREMRDGPFDGARRGGFGDGLRRLAAAR